MFRANFDPNSEMGLYQAALMQQQRATGRFPATRRFDEYYRCYPIAMLPGPDRDRDNHGGKLFLPPSALDKLTRLHITYPMLFELINGAVQEGADYTDTLTGRKRKRRTKTHAGVLEFIAEEGKAYLPYWLMETLSLDPGDLVQILSTDLPPGTFIKLQPQTISFLDISDPKAVLENAFRNFSCLSVGDVFTFRYNDEVFPIEVLEVRPDSSRAHAICTLETDLSVDFAPPVGYEEHLATQQAEQARLKSEGKLGVTHIQSQGSMAKAINYADIAPNSSVVVQGQRATDSLFAGQVGQRLKGGKGSPAAGTPMSSNTPLAGQSTNKPPTAAVPARSTARRRNGPQPLRLPENKLFFGYEIKAVKKKDEDGAEPKGFVFQGQAQQLRKKKGTGSGSGTSTPSGK